MEHRDWSNQGEDNTQGVMDKVMRAIWIGNSHIYVKSDKIDKIILFQTSETSILKLDTKMYPNDAYFIEPLLQ